MPNTTTSQNACTCTSVKSSSEPTLPSSADYDPKDYWENRLTKDFSLGGVGYIGMGKAYNSWTYRSRVCAVQESMKQLGITTADKHVLDVGAGTGFWVEFWRQHKVRSVSGVDITEKSVRKLQQRYPGYAFYVRDISAREWDITERYDIVSVFDVFQHIVDETCFEQAVANLSSNLAADGYIVICDALVTDPVPPLPHRHFRTLDRYYQVLRQNHITPRGLFPVSMLLQAPVDLGCLNRWEKILLPIVWKRVTWRIGHSRRLQILGKVVFPAFHYADRLLVRHRLKSPSINILIGQRT